MMRNFLVGMLLISLLFCAGCVEHRDISDLNMVLGAMIDYDPELAKYIVYVQVAAPGAFSKDGGTRGKTSFMLFQGEGKTFFQAIRDAAKDSGKRLFWGHCYVYVITERLAQQGFFGVLDFLCRDYEIRETAYLMVTDKKPDQFVTLESQAENVPLINLKELLDLGIKRHGTTFPMKLSDVFRDYLAEDSNYVIPLVGIEKSHLKTKSPAVTDELHANRAVVVKKDKMIGVLGSEETRGYLWIRRKETHGIVVAEPEGKPMSLEEIGHKAKITPQVNQGEISFLIELKSELNYGEIDLQANVQDEKFVRATEEAASRVLAQEIEKSIQKSQDMKADFFNLGRELQLAYPDTWQAVREEWSEKVFPDVAIKVSVKAQILRTGLLTANHLGGMKNEQGR